AAHVPERAPIGGSLLASDQGGRVAGQQADRGRLARQVEERPAEEVERPVADEVRRASLLEPHRVAAAVARPPRAIVVEGQLGDDSRPPPARVRLELVDPVPPDALGERKHLLEALPPVAPCRAPDRRAREVPGLPALLVELVTAAARDAELGLGREAAEEPG